MLLVLLLLLLLLLWLLLSSSPSSASEACLCRRRWWWWCSRSRSRSLSRWCRFFCFLLDFFFLWWWWWWWWLLLLFNSAGVCDFGASGERKSSSVAETANNSSGSCRCSSSGGCSSLLPLLLWLIGLLLRVEGLVVVVVVFVVFWREAEGFPVAQKFARISCGCSSQGACVGWNTTSCRRRLGSKIQAVKKDTKMLLINYPYDFVIMQINFVIQMGFKIWECITKIVFNAFQYYNIVLIGSQRDILILIE